MDLTIQTLRELCGYVENGTDTVVTVFQDDATRDWFVKVGKQTFTGRSLPEALQAATVVIER
jgi:hypothetical protein